MSMSYYRLLLLVGASVLRFSLLPFTDATSTYLGGNFLYFNSATANLHWLYTHLTSLPALLGLAHRLLSRLLSSIASAPLSAITSLPHLLADHLLHVNRELRRDLRQDLVRSFFTLSVLVWACFYDRFRNNYISRIFQHDKYGVVLVYTFVTLAIFLDDFTFLTNHLDWQADVQSQVDRNNAELRAEQLQRREHVRSGTTISLFDADHQLEFDPPDFSAVVGTPATRHRQLVDRLTLTQWTVLKALAVTLIFMMNTSREERAHQTVHLLMVVVLGCFAFASMVAKTRADVYVADFGRGQAIRSFLFAVVFQVLGWAQQRRWLPDTPLWNVIVTLAEAILVEQTI